MTQTHKITLCLAVAYLILIFLAVGGTSDKYAENIISDTKEQNEQNIQEFAEFIQHNY